MMDCTAWLAGDRHMLIVLTLCHPVTLKKRSPLQRYQRNSSEGWNDSCIGTC